MSYGGKSTPKGNHKATGKVGSQGRSISGGAKGKGARNTGGLGTNAKSVPGGAKGKGPAANSARGGVSDTSKKHGKVPHPPHPGS
jgi:hypothetical protein